MNRCLKAISTIGLAVALLVGVTVVADAQTSYTTSKPVLSGTPHKDKSFTVSGVITPKSAAQSRAKVKIILWMKNGDSWGVMDTYWTKLSARPAGHSGTKYSRSITIPMKGDHGVQAVQYRNGKQVSKSRIASFTVQP
jgi:hypothetical protein